MARRPVRVYGGFGDFAALQPYGAWYDAALDIARSVIPSGTIVGNAIGSTREKGGSVSIPQPYPYTTTQMPTTTMPESGTPSWLLPVAIGAGFLLIFTMMRPARR